MKKITRLAALLLLVVPVIFTACVKDNCSRLRTYSFYEPVYKTKDEVRANIKSLPARTVNNPGKLYIFGSYIFLNDKDKGIHVIDNSNPASPLNIAFIEIPGNLDLAVKGNTLYADLYTDLVTIDISNPAQVVLKKVSENVFPYRYWGGGFSNTNPDSIITDWMRKDTTVKEDCNQNRYITFTTDVFFAGNSGSLASVSPIGQGGSMARFTIMGNRLYTVSDQGLDVFDISNAQNPVSTNRVNIGWDIETIYPFRDKLFIGSMTGMFIYNVSNPDAPAPAGQFNHVRTCDPVIADDDYAYVTLRSGTPCRGFTNELDIVDIRNIFDPRLLKVYGMQNPHGLSKDGDLLFICDGTAGLKIFNASDVHNLVPAGTINGISTYDVICRNNIALVVAEDGLYQYDYSNLQNIRLLSKLAIRD